MSGEIQDVSETCGLAVEMCESGALATIGDDDMENYRGRGVECRIVDGGGELEGVVAWDAETFDRMRDMPESDLSAAGLV